MVRELALTAGTEPYLVHGRVLLLGTDLVVVIWGGAPHVGAVAIAQPRASLRDERRRSATSSVITMLGHKEDVVARKLSERLAATLDRRVVVSAGLHWDDLSPADIAQVLAACDSWAELLLREIGQANSSPSSVDHNASA